ncbi:MAG: hypothetical protein AAGA91_14740 [Pseudomonadota bacterium]
MAALSSGWALACARAVAGSASLINLLYIYTVLVGLEQLSNAVKNTCRLAEQVGLFYEGMVVKD